MSIVSYRLRKPYMQIVPANQETKGREQGLRSIVGK